MMHFLFKLILLVITILWIVFLVWACSSVINIGSGRVDSQSDATVEPQPLINIETYSDTIIIKRDSL